MRPPRSGEARRRRKAISPSDTDPSSFDESVVSGAIKTRLATAVPCWSDSGSHSLDVGATLTRPYCMALIAAMASTSISQLGSASPATTTTVLAG